MHKLSTYIFSCMFTSKGCAYLVDMVKVILKIPTVVTRSYICHFNLFRQYLDRIFSQIQEETDCFGKTYQTLKSNCTRTIYLNFSLYDYFICCSICVNSPEWHFFEKTAHPRALDFWGAKMNTSVHLQISII